MLVLAGLEVSLTREDRIDVVLDGRSRHGRPPEPSFSNKREFNLAQQKVADEPIVAYYANTFWSQLYYVPKRPQSSNPMLCGR